MSICCCRCCCFSCECAGTLPTSWGSQVPAAEGASNSSAASSSGSSSLTTLDLSANALHGTLPASWVALLPGLTTLDLSHNALTGELPPAWGRFANLTTL